MNEYIGIALLPLDFWELSSDNHALDNQGVIAVELFFAVLTLTQVFNGRRK